MHKAKAFFYVCAGIFLLALSYHLGATSATAQQPGSPIAGITAVNDGAGNRVPMVVLSNGDLYTTASATGQGGPFVYRGNIISAPTPAMHESFGALKNRYRGTPGAAQLAPQDR